MKAEARKLRGEEAETARAARAAIARKFERAANLMGTAWESGEPENIGLRELINMPIYSMHLSAYQIELVRQFRNLLSNFRSEAEE